ncbi:MAG: hypothetical protein WB445_13225, partial [Acinetobacter sp.]
MLYIPIDILLLFEEISSKMHLFFAQDDYCFRAFFQYAVFFLQALIRQRIYAITLVPAGLA